MQIAFLVGEFPSLSETFILNQITGLLDRGHDVHIYGRKPSDLSAQHSAVREYDLLDKVHYIPRIPTLKPERVWEALRMLAAARSTIGSSYLFRSLQPQKYGRVASNLQVWYAASIFGDQVASYDVIHAHFGPNGALAVALRDLGCIEGKIVTTFHGSDMTRYLKRTGSSGYNFLAAEGDLFLPISNRWKQKLIDIGFPKDQIHVHHMGVDCDEIDFAPSTVESNETIRLLSIARLTEKKGIQYGIRALNQCLNKSDVHAEYTIVGDGELRQPLEALVQELNIEENVRFTGWKSKSEVQRLLGNAHIFLAPSVTAESGDQEGIPVAIMEAMARGLPVISTWHSGIPELVEDERSGLLVPERDAEALADALQTLLETPECLLEMGKAGRRIVEEQFSTQNLNDQLEDYYRSVCSQR
jgi:colanic acid/amylovoran biosynthesis glycosyltransferase